MGWLKTEDTRYPMPFKGFIIPKKEFLEACGLRPGQLPDEPLSDPVRLEEVCRRVVLKYRPELADGLVIEGMNFEYPMYAFVVYCIHPSFPRKNLYETIEREILEREPQPVHVGPALGAPAVF